MKNIEYNLEVIKYITEWVSSFQDPKKKTINLWKHSLSPEDILQEINDKTSFGLELYDIAVRMYNDQNKPAPIE